MRFTPKSERELAKEREEFENRRLAPPGRHGFTILECGNAVSKAGSEMVKVKINVHAPERDQHVYDYISPAFMGFKFRHFFFAIGRGEDYERGVCEPANYVGLTGYAEIGIEKARDGYDAKNTVKDYDGRQPDVDAPKGQEAEPPNPETSHPADDNLPGDPDVPF